MDVPSVLEVMGPGGLLVKFSVVKRSEFHCLVLVCVSPVDSVEPD